MTSPNDPTETYLQQSNNWEVDQMIAAKKSEKKAWIVAGSAMGIAFMAVGAVLGLTPLKTSEPYVIRVNETTGVVDVVKSMKDAKTTYEEVVRKADLRKYVRARESYSYSLAEHYYTTVGLMSSPELADKYQQFYNPKTNPKDSPVAKYGEFGSVVIDIKSVSFINDKAASVNYIRKEYSDQSAASRPEVTEWVATVTYKYVNAPQKDADREINPFGFQVIEYRNDPVAITKTTGARE